MGLARWALVACAACSGNKTKTAGDAATTAPKLDAQVVDAAPPPSTGGIGDAQIRVEWKNVPAVRRNSPGPTPCHTPRGASVAPTTTWGIPDVLVIVDGDRETPAEARVVLADCALAPRLVVGETVIVDSAVLQPARVTLTKHGEAGKLAALAATAPRTIQLPIAGHAVAIALEPGAVYQLATDGKDPEATWIVDAPAHVTDATGAVVVKGLAGGVHAVTAWLPARGNQPARIATGKVTVVANELAELTIDLGAASPP
ncbi:MAG TPA: hypothetical protein VFQ53_29400 [Kofleriaceae bacterium]|nr:hypothetical protein [Kofleriaceae bacterium]